MPMKSLFLQAPSFDGYDGGAGTRYQMKREVKSFWFPTWLAQAAAMRALGRMIGTAKRGKDLNDGKEFAATQASVFLDGFTFRRFLEDCYSENRRRMGVFDKELLRPSFLPQLAETALGAMRLWSFRAKPLPA